MAVMRGFNGPLSLPRQPIFSDRNALLEMLQVNMHLRTLEFLELIRKDDEGRKKCYHTCHCTRTDVVVDGFTD